MKTIGLLGGVTWQSTALYYKFINEKINLLLGSNNAGKLIINSVNFAEVRKIQIDDGWEGLGSFLAANAQKLEKAGADFILLGANTIHKVADIIQDAVSIPIINIVEVVADILRKEGIKKCGLLGTKYTMEENFFIGKLQDEYGIEAIVPEIEDRDFIHHIIYNELSLAIISKETEKRLIRIIGSLKDLGAESVILGCTELGMIINESNSPLPALDTARAHAEKAVELAIEERDKV